MRIGWSDYVLTADTSAPRTLFLCAVQVHVPEALTAAGALAPGEEDALQAWGSQFRLMDAWLLNIVRLNVPVWHATPETRGRWLWFGGGGGWVPVQPQPPGEWRIGIESEETYRQRVEAYIASMKAGATRAREKSVRHFEWLALHTAGGLRYADIAERYQDSEGNPNESAISKAVTEVADLIGLTLPAARGRKFP